MTAPQTENFVPLTSAPDPGKNAEFRVTLIPQATRPQPFQSLESHGPPAANGSAKSGKCEPRVTLQREGDRVTSIRVQCTCGHVIDLACVYDAPAKPA